MDNENISNSAGRMIDEGREQLNEYADKANDMLSDYADKGMDYVSSANSAMTTFIREEPLLSMVTVFAAGYLAARILNQLTRR